MQGRIPRREDQGPLEVSRGGGPVSDRGGVERAFPVRLRLRAPACGRRGGRRQGHPGGRRRRRRRGALADTVRPVHLDAAVHVGPPAGRPRDRQGPDPGRVAEADLLLQARPAEAAAAADRDVDVPVARRGHDGDAHPGADGHPVRLDALEPERDPLVAVARVQVEGVRRRIALEGPAEHVVHVLIAVAVDIAERHAVAFLQMPEPARRGHVLEEGPPGVAEHQVRDEHAVVRVARAEIHVEESVVVQIPEVRPHAHHDPVEPNRARDVGERAVAVVAVQPRELPAVRLPEPLEDDVRQPSAEPADEEVLPAVVVVVEEPGREAHRRTLHARLGRRIAKRPRAVRTRPLRCGTAGSAGRAAAASRTGRPGRRCRSPPTRRP